MKKPTSKKPKTAKRQPVVARIEGKREIVIYQAPGKKIEVQVRTESLWLSLAQVAALFGVNKPAVSKHFKNIYGSGELDKEGTVSKMETVQREGRRIVHRQVEMYNLDAVISVGYRVNSTLATRFRIWATGVLRDHLVKGYSVNARRLAELQQSLRLVGRVLERYDVTSDQARGLLAVVTDYASALDLLDDYDHQRVTMPPLKPQAAKGIDYDEAMTIVGELHRKFGGSDLFGKEKDQSLRSSLGAVMQTFDGKNLYPSLEEKAAHLLYFLVKNHSFVDGNKRLAAAMFLWFMEKNSVLYRADGSRHIADNALVAITLMIAESDPSQKDILTRVVVNLIKDGRGVS